MHCKHVIDVLFSVSLNKSPDSIKKCLRIVGNLDFIFPQVFMTAPFNLISATNYKQLCF